MELTVHITYFPMERQYGASLWLGDKMLDMDYQLYDYEVYALKAGAKLKEKYLKQEAERRSEMSLYTTLMRQGFTEKEASNVATQMANRLGEAFIEFDPAWVMHELDEGLVDDLREGGKEVYWFEVNEEKYFDGGIRVPYLVLVYDMAKLRSNDV